MPSLIAVLWLLNVLHAQRLVAALLDLITAVMPGAADGPLRDQIVNAPRSQASGTLTFGALLSLVVALWALASMFRAVMEAMNAMYAVEEGRSAVKRFAMSLMLSLAVVAMLIGALVLVVFGSAIAERLAGAAGMGVVLRWAWVIVSWPVVIALVAAAFSMVYYFAPDVEQRFRWVSAGSAAAVVMWLVFTLLFSLYVNNVVRVDQVYGALAGIAVLMIYVYSTAFILLLGAEINQIIEIRDPAGKNEGEKFPGDGRAAHAPV